METVFPAPAGLGTSLGHCLLKWWAGKRKYRVVSLLILHLSASPRNGIQWQPRVCGLQDQVQPVRRPRQDTESHSTRPSRARIYYRGPGGVDRVPCPGPSLQRHWERALEPGSGGQDPGIRYHCSSSSGTIQEQTMLWLLLQIA